MKNKKILLIIGTVSLVLAIVLLIGVVIYNNKSIVLNNNYKKISLKVSSKNEKVATNCSIKKFINFTV